MNKHITSLKISIIGHKEPCGSDIFQQLERLTARCGAHIKDSLPSMCLQKDGGYH
eukprot:XP_001706835.1 Hypothetical protein GL50803_114746 [Giardia lamblia ATCC 50803]